MPLLNESLCNRILRLELPRARSEEVRRGAGRSIAVRGFCAPGQCEVTRSAAALSARSCGYGFDVGTFTSRSEALSAVAEARRQTSRRTLPLHVATRGSPLALI